MSDFEFGEDQYGTLRVDMGDSTIWSGDIAVVRCDGEWLEFADWDVMTGATDWDSVRSVRVGDVVEWTPLGGTALVLRDGEVAPLEEVGGGEYVMRAAPVGLFDAPILFRQRFGGWAAYCRCGDGAFCGGIGEDVPLDVEIGVGALKRLVEVLLYG